MFSLVYAVFHATVRVVDVAKKNALHTQLLASVISTGPGEKLDERLSALTLKTKTGISRTRELHDDSNVCTTDHELPGYVE